MYVTLNLVGFVKFWVQSIKVCQNLISLQILCIGILNENFYKFVENVQFSLYVNDCQL